MFPAFTHFRRTTTEETELNGVRIGKGEKVVMRYASSNRDSSRYEDPERFDVTRNPEHQAFGQAAGTSASGRRWRALSSGSCSRRPWSRYPADGDRRQARRWRSRRSSTSSRRCPFACSPQR